ncbi:hypothetical protein ACINNAV57_A0084 [Acinetobacter baumannii Naval-57]|nr:hypothetical protein ACINNAV57_A0084 [Acinetobacter baumannii Naval-57]
MCYLHLQHDNKNFGEETLSNLFINHKNCPECGGRIKGYYYYCGQWGSQNVVNWKHTGIFLLIAGKIFLVAMLFLLKNFVQIHFFHKFHCANFLNNS